MELSDYDDLPIHQTSQPVAYPATSDMRFFERGYFNVHHRAGLFSLVFGWGAYPNVNSMDGFTCAITKDEGAQYNARFFRELHFDRTELGVGSLRLEPVRPMHSWRLSLTENDFGVTFDLLMEARSAPWYQVFSHAHPTGVAPITNFSHVVQGCSYRGGVTIGDKKFEGDFLGCRDRSWGIRTLAGMATPGGADARRWAMHFWWNPQFDEASYYIFYSEDAEGHTLLVHGGVRGGRFDGRHWVAMEHSLEFGDAESQELLGGVVVLTDDHGDTHRIRIAPALPGVYLLGGGYGGHSQGKYRGELAEGEKWDLAGASPTELARYVNRGQSPTDKLALFTLDDGTSCYGVAEFSIRPEYQRYP